LGCIHHRRNYPQQSARFRDPTMGGNRFHRRNRGSSVGEYNRYRTDKFNNHHSAKHPTLNSIENKMKILPCTHSASLLALALLGATLSGCLVLHTDNSSVNGKKVSAAQLAKITPGTSKQDVVEALGVPTSKNDLGNGLEVWEWKYTQNTDKTSGFIFIFLSNDTSSVSQSTSVEFLNGVVTKTWVTDNKAKSDSDKTPDKD
jgi:outer membrane protein assembly factor BamE (lipoprotein component of BamABCDE complex)